MPQFDQVSVVKKSNVYFDGKCVSHTVLFPNGERKTLGVLLPPCSLTFNVGAAEVMEIASGTCRVKIAGEDEFKTYAAGSSFQVVENSSFIIEANEPVDYICSYAK